MCCADGAPSVSCPPVQIFSWFQTLSDTMTVIMVTVQLCDRAFVLAGSVYSSSMVLGVYQTECPLNSC